MFYSVTKSYEFTQSGKEKPKKNPRLSDLSLNREGEGRALSGHHCFLVGHTGGEKIERFRVITYRKARRDFFFPPFSFPFFVFLFCVRGFAELPSAGVKSSNKFSRIHERRRRGKEKGKKPRCGN